MKKIILAISGVLALMLGGITASTASASTSAAPILKIVKVGYNANGNDVLTNRWKEYIDIRNISTGPVNVDGWFTQDAWARDHRKTSADDCNVAVFRKAASASDERGFHHLDATGPGGEPGLWLPKGETIRVYTGGNADATDNKLHTIALNKDKCGYNGHYLGNGGDTVYLRKADGTLVDRFSYSFEHGYYVG